MERTKWIEAKGKKILYSDYSGLKTTEELVAVLDEQIKQASLVPSKFLGMSNFADASVSSEFMDKINKAGKEIFEAKVEKIAVLGITGLKSVLFQAYMRFTGAKTTKTFNTEEEAIAYLVS